MAEKKTATTKAASTTKATSAKKTTEKAPSAKTVAAKTTTSKTSAKASGSAELYVNSYTAGFRAGDVYQTLAAAGKTMSLAELMKAAQISRDEALLGIGWLLKEGKIEGENVDDIRLA